MIPDCFPDTVRFRIPIPREIYDAFCEQWFTDRHKIVHRSIDGYESEWSKALLKYPSHFSDMVFMPSSIVGKTFSLAEGKKVLQWLSDSVDIEYSAHKWMFKSSCFNNGECTFDYIFQPIEDVLRGHLKFSEQQIAYSRKYCFLRRIDLSCNFQFDPMDTGYTVGDLVNQMLRFKFNRADHESKNGLCKFHSGESIRWGNGNSRYSVIFYDKGKEYRAHYKEKKQKRKAISAEEQTFFDRHVNEIKELLRFEVNFRTRWFNEGLKDYYEKNNMKRITHPPFLWR